MSFRIVYDEWDESREEARLFSACSVPGGFGEQVGDGDGELGQRFEMAERFGLTQATRIAAAIGHVHGAFVRVGDPDRVGAATVVLFDASSDLSAAVVGGGDFDDQGGHAVGDGAFQFGEPVSPGEVADGGKANGVGVAGRDHPEIEAGESAVRVDAGVQEVGQGFRDVQHDVAVHGVGGIEGDETAGDEFGPAAAFGEFESSGGELFDGEFGGVAHGSFTPSLRRSSSGEHRIRGVSSLRYDAAAADSRGNRPVRPTSDDDCSRVPMTTTIRTYLPEDLPTLKEIMVEAFDGVSIDQGMEREFGTINGHDWRWRKARHLDVDAEREPEGIFVVEIDDRIAGFISSWLDVEAGIGHVPNISFRPEYRGRGLGRRVLELVLARFREAGLTHAKIETLVQNDVGNHLYQSMGFREVARQIHFVADLSEDASADE